MSQPTSPLIRERFGNGIDSDGSLGKWAQAWLNLLLTQDGSATLICDTIAGMPVRLDVLHQTITEDVPDGVRDHIDGVQFVERQVCLSYNGHIMMDNLTYAGLDVLDADVKHHLLEDTAPIGHIFKTKATRKIPVTNIPPVLDRLWMGCGSADERAVRTYILQIHDVPSMLITETFRAGMHIGLPLK